MKNFLFSGAIASVALGGMMGHTSETPSTAVDEAEKLLTALAQKHGTTPQAILGAVMEKQMARRFPLKGGLNVVGAEVFAVAGEERNTLIVGKARERWQGAPRPESEMVLVANQEVLGRVPIPKDISVRDLTFVWFSPEKVYFLNGNTFNAGYLHRPKPK
ncbi:hypothetical protein [Melittangium boletus]|uniref:hypothetical protein n=1 Tax=Melittangium boletus TaxID=83453 RepID=UPI003DA451A8